MRISSVTKASLFYGSIFLGKRPSNLLVIYSTFAHYDADFVWQRFRDGGSVNLFDLFRFQAQEYMSPKLRYFSHSLVKDLPE